MKYFHFTTPAPSSDAGSITTIVLANDAVEAKRLAKAHTGIPTKNLKLFKKEACPTGSHVVSCDQEKPVTV